MYWGLTKDIQISMGITTKEINVIIISALDTDIVVFKVWNYTRDLKTIVTMRESEDNLLLRLIAKASAKMNIIGVDLVLESDGTKIDEDDVLKLMKYEVMMLLQPGEDWQEPQFDPFTTTKQALEGPKSTYPESTLEDHHHDKTARCLCKFQIPWEEMFSRHILEACDQGKRDKRLVTHIIHGVVNKMREIDSCFASQSQASKAVTKQIVSRFPLTFQEIDENGAVIGDGSRGVYRKLVDRHKNMNRYLKKHLSIF